VREKFQPLDRDAFVSLLLRAAKDKVAAVWRKFSVVTKYVPEKCVTVFFNAFRGMLVECFKTGLGHF
jgi:hypothetical protein